MNFFIRTQLLRHVATVLLAVVWPASADIVNEDQRLAPASVDGGAMFGDAVALGSSWLFVGAPFDDGGGSEDQELGVVFNYSLGNEQWEPASFASMKCYGFAPIQPGNCQRQYFGHSLAIDQQEDGSFYLAIGRYRFPGPGLFGAQSARVNILYHDGNSFDWNNDWSMTESEPTEDFGGSLFPSGTWGSKPLALSGTGFTPTALAGAPRRPGVTFLALDDSDDPAEDLLPEGVAGSFGRAVAVDGDRAAVGNSQAVFLFSRSAQNPDFALAATITAPEGAESFGQSLGLRDRSLLVGAHDTDVDGMDGAGRAYLYDFDNPQVPQHVFEANDPETFEHLGWDVTFGEDFAAIAAPGGDGSWNGTMKEGRILVFDLETGERRSELVLGTPSETDYFGATLDAQGYTVAVGAPRDDNDTGSVYLFTVPAPEPGPAMSLWAALGTLAAFAKTRRRA